MNTRYSRVLLFVILCNTHPQVLFSQSITFSQHVVADSFSSFGCAVADYDGDGWDDIFVTGWYSTALFHNNQNGTFTDLSIQAGVRCQGRYCVGLWGDLNNDGLPDLFVGARDAIGTNRIFLNNGNGTFSDISSVAGIKSTVSVGAAAFGDFNNDGKLDLFIATNDATSDLLYENISHGDSVLFRDVSDSAGIGGNPNTFAMQATWIDYNHDGYPDLFCVHDGYVPNRLYRNTGRFPFTEVAGQAHLASYGAANSMGVAWCDFNNDGWEDVYVSNIGTGGFYRNNGDGTFTDITQSSGAALNGMSWGVVFPDLDNDGDQDLFIANMYDFDNQKSLLYENVNGKFRDTAALANADLTAGSFGAATGDFNNDGYEDIFVTNYNNPPGQNFLLLNSRTKTGHWVKILLHGTTVNRMAVGTKIRVVAGGTSQIRIVDGGSSYCSQISPTLHVGLGAAISIDTLEILWRIDNVQRFTNLQADTTYSIREGSPLTTVGDKQEPALPQKTELLPNYPNPFNPITDFEFRIADFGFVTLKIYDVLGREVAVLLNERKQAGSYTVVWNAGEMPSGVYLARLTVVFASQQSFQETREVLLVK